MSVGVVEVPVDLEAEVTSWGTENAAPPPVQYMFWFTMPDGSRFTHLDLTGGEALALEERLGIPWGELRPVVVVAHGLAILETFLARTDPTGAAARVKAMTMRQLEAAIVYEAGWGDDLPSSFEDGSPKAEKDAH